MIRSIIRYIIGDPAPKAAARLLAKRAAEARRIRELPLSARRQWVREDLERSVQRQRAGT